MNGLAILTRIGKVQLPNPSPHRQVYWVGIHDDMDPNRKSALDTYN